MTVHSHLPRSGLVLLLINAILSTCVFALVLAAFCHTDWAHTTNPYLPRAGLTYQTYIGPWRQCDVGHDGPDDDTSAPINPSSGQCRDPDFVNDKIDAFRAFLCISLFFSFIGMIMHWIRFAQYAANKMIGRGLDIAIILVDVMTVISNCVVMGIVPYILDDIQNYVEARAAAGGLNALGFFPSANYGDSARIWIAALVASIVLMFSQIITYFAILRRVDYSTSAHSAHTVKGTELQQQPAAGTYYPNTAVASQTTIDNRV